MKTLMFLLLAVLFIANPAFSQPNRNDELKVEFVKATHTDIYAVIVSQAEENWSDDYNMQAYEIKKESIAFFDLIGIGKEHPNVPKDALNKIIISSMNKWAKGEFVKSEGLASMRVDWSMALYTAKKQIKAYKELH